jgi:opacity protein-like surface antigen
MNTLTRITVFVSLIALLSTASASGEYRKPLLGVAVFGGLSVPMGDLANNRLYDVRFGGILGIEETFFFSNSIGIGFAVSIEKFKIGKGSELYQEGISRLEIIDWEIVSVTFFLNTKKKLQPYLKSNIGASELRFKTGGSSKKSGNPIAVGASAGLLYIFTSKNIGVFGEVSYRYSQAKHGDLGSQRYSTPRLRVKLGVLGMLTPGP